MNYIRTIKSGFDVINRNWQLVAIQMIVLMINFLLFLIIVIVPLVLSAVAIGLDIEGLSDIQNLSRNIGSYLAQYLGLILVGIVFVLLYLLIISVVSIYLYGASSGIIAHSIRNPSDTFSLQRFFTEGKKLFWPMFRYIAVVLLVLNTLLIIVAVIFVIMLYLSDFLKGFDSDTGFFISMFFMLLSISIILFAVTFGLAITFYGTAILIFHGKGAFESLKEAMIFIYKRQAAYWFYCVLLGASVVVALVLTLMGLSIHEVPVFGVFLTIPYQIFTYIAQSYFGLVILAVIFVYYFLGGITADRSIQESGTSKQGDSGQGEIPPY